MYLVTKSKFFLANNLGCGLGAGAHKTSLPSRVLGVSKEKGSILCRHYICVYIYIYIGLVIPYSLQATKEVTFLCVESEP